jgi:hypothetical protein
VRQQKVLINNVLFIFETKTGANPYLFSLFACDGNVREHFSDENFYLCGGFKSEYNRFFGRQGYGVRVARFLRTTNPCKIFQSGATF